MLKLKSSNLTLDKFLELMSPRQEATGSFISYHIVGHKESTTMVESPTRPGSRFTFLFKVNIHVNNRCPVKSVNMVSISYIQYIYVYFTVYMIKNVFFYKDPV